MLRRINAESYEKHFIHPDDENQGHCSWDVVVYIIILTSFDHERDRA